MDQAQLAIWQELKAKIASSSKSGASGERITEIKDLAEQLDKALSED